MEYDLPADDLVEDIFNLFDRHNASLEQQVGALMISISSVLAHFDDKDAELNVVCDGIRQMTNDIEIEYDD